MGTKRRWLTRTVLVGVGATAAMDLGGEIVRRTTGAQPLDYALVGRWIGHMPEGRFAHPSIGKAEPVPGEKQIGTLAHYSIGVSFAGMLLASHRGWGDRPTLGPALATGVGSVVAPWLLMMPAFGLGVAGSKTPDPTTARLGSLRAHATYGLGLYLAGRAVSRLTRRR